MSHHHLLATSEYVPRAKPEVIARQVVVLADVKYWGPPKDPKAVARVTAKILAINAEIKDLRERARRNGWSARIIRPDLQNLLEVRRELEEDLQLLPRIEVWRREYKVLRRL